ncbi:MAG: hypothetical protein KDD14_23975 [Saprospiraceae bacterium]|nr:hypothetical protein [Saprospiraceae bacterium]
MKAKSIIYIAALAIAFSNIAYSQKIDTAQIKTQINSLKSGDAVQRALHKVIEEDQKFRGSQTNDSLDLLHLIWLSYFVQKFGYPDKKFFGNDAFASSIIWIHNHRKLRIISFPIILKGFLSGQIREKDLRDYYLRTIYTYRFDDDGYLRMPLKELFEKLELNTSDSIPVEALLKTASEIYEFKNESRETIGVWKSDGRSKTYDHQGDKIEVEFEGERAEIFKLQNGKIYLSLSSSYGSKEPQELYRSRENQYRFRNLHTDTYYTINKEELHLVNGEKIINRYKKIN